MMIKRIIVLIVNNIRGVVSGVMSDQFKESIENRTVWYIDSKTLHGSSMSETLPYKDFITTKCVSLKTILETSEYAATGYLPDVKLHCPLSKTDKTKNFRFCPENKKRNTHNFIGYMLSK